MFSRARIFAVGLLVFVTLVGGMPLNSAGAAAPQSLTPASLSLSPIPSKLPADNNTYPAIVVSILDKASNPTVALADVQVSLTSSQENVAKISDAVVIPAGQTYAIANLTTTNTAGVATITATTPGLTTASVAMTTVVAVGYPTHLVLSAIPNTVPARASNTGKLIMELEDDVGLPAKAISFESISLFSSNAHVVNVTSPNVTMKQGDYLAEVDYASGFVPGSAVITASAPGFDSGLVTVTVLGFPPLAVRVFAQPDLMVICTPAVAPGGCTGRLVVALTDPNGNPTRASRDITIQIRSSNLAIINTSEAAVIKEGALSVIANYSVTALAGVATITASSPGLQSGFADIATAAPQIASPQYCENTAGGPTPCNLRVFTGPNPVLADHQSYSSVVVSMWNDTAPMINSTGTTRITLTSSVTGVGNFTSVTFGIPKGQNWAAIIFTSTFQVGLTRLTASSPNFLPFQVGLTTFGPVPSKVVLKPISTQLPADGNTHAALELDLEDAFGSPAIAPFNVPINITSSHSSIIKVSPAIIPGGQSFVVVNVTAGILQGTANVTALVSAFTTGYTTSWAILGTVIPAPSSLAAFAPDGNKIMATPAGPLPLIAIQLEGGGLTPARARTAMNISITSSNSTVLAKVLIIGVTIGQDYVLVDAAPLVPGTTTLTISTPGLSVATLSVTFLPFPVTETISGGPSKIFTNQTAFVSVVASLDGAPLKGTSVHWNASSGGLIVATQHPSNSSSTTTTTTTQTTTKSATSTRSSTAASPPGSPSIDDTTDKTGSSVTIFKPSKPGLVLITATMAPIGLPSKTLNFTIQVTAPPAAVAKAGPSLTQQLTSFPLLLLPVGGVGGAVAVTFLLIRRRGKGAAGSEDFDSALE